MLYVHLAPVHVLTQPLGTITPVLSTIALIANKLQHIRMRHIRIAPSVAA